MYDKFGFILRIETTSNDITFLKHFRDIAKRDGSIETKYASMKKSIYSMETIDRIIIGSKQSLY